LHHIEEVTQVRTGACERNQIIIRSVERASMFLGNSVFVQSDPFETW